MLSKASLKLAGRFLHLWQRPKKAIRLGVLWLVVSLAALISFIYLTNMSMDKVRAAPAPYSSQAAASAGFNTLPVHDVTRQITAGVDIMIVFDISASMEDQTICHDCYVRTSFDPRYHTAANGYFNPLPYDPTWAITGTGNQSIPASSLCTEPVSPTLHSGFQYLVMEAELYSAEVGNWDLSARTPGQGFWVLQRGSYQGGTGPLGEPSFTRQSNQAGVPAQQSSNVCNPQVNGIDCLVGPTEDNVCSSADGGIAVDCSAYLSARPFINYSQSPGNNPSLTGGAYNLDCFLPGAGPHPIPPFTGSCWTNPIQNPFVAITGPGPSDVPWVEYDFTPTWNGNTTIWIRAIGGGREAFTWAGNSPDQLLPDLNGGGPGNNVSPWQKAIYWQVDNDQVYESNDSNLNTCCANAGEWRDNRAETQRWRWIKLGSTTTLSGTQSTFKLYQGSAGYKVDKIIFTNDSSGTSNNPPAAMLLDYPAGLPPTQQALDVGPPASRGSATREACNVCNPAFGYTVDPSQCTCRRDGSETGFGTGLGCTTLLTLTNQLQDDLYSGIQPLRSAQEAVKHFARQLNPQCHQLGLVAYSTDTENGSDRRSKLQCLRWASTQLGEAGRCYDPSLGVPISHTNVISVVERHWASSATDIAEGLREGLEDLGVPGYTLDSNCTAPTNDRQACDRGGAAQKVMILVTDGTPNVNPGSCAPGSGRPDLWNGLLGTNDDNFECAMYFAWEAANNNVILHTIGIGSAVNPDLLTAMATGTDPGTDTVHFTGRGGQYFQAAKATDLDLIFEHILGLIPDCGVGGGGLNGEQIWSISGYTVEQNQNLTVHLENHFTASGPYDIYLGDMSSTYKICSAVNTGPTNAGDFECSISSAIPPGFYNLYSTLAADQNPLAIAPLPVEVQVSSSQDTCDHPLAENSFENTPLTKWVLGSNQGVAQVPGSAHSGNFKLMGPTFDGQFFNPFFYQKFTLPTWVNSTTTTLDLSLYKNVDPLVDGNDPDDQFSVVLSTVPSLSGTLVTTSAQIANGDIGSVPYNPLDWQEVNVQLPVANGVNLADYAGQDLYLYFYNNSNQSVGCPPTNPNCYATKFYFDDVDLGVCDLTIPWLTLTKTSAPNPATAGQPLTYTLTLNNSGAVSITGVLITDALPSAVSFASASEGGLHQAGVVTWNIGLLPFSQTVSRTVVVTVSNVASGTILSNTAWVTSSEGISRSALITTPVFNPGVSPIYLPTIFKSQ